MVSGTCVCCPLQRLSEIFVFLIYLQVKRPYEGHIFLCRILLEYFYVLLTVRLSVILDNDQLDTHLLYFTIRLL